MELVFVLLVLLAVVYGIVKDYNPQAVLALAGMAIFTVAYWLGLHPILPADKSTGFALFDLFEVFKDLLLPGGGPRPHHHGGGRLCHLHVPYRCLPGAGAGGGQTGGRHSVQLPDAGHLLSGGGVCLLFVTSATGLGLLLMVTMYPVMRNLGISPASACGVIATSQAFEIGPTQTNAIFSASQSGMDPTSYFVDYQIWLVAPCCW